MSVESTLAGNCSEEVRAPIETRKLFPSVAAALRRPGANMGLWGHILATAAICASVAAVVRPVYGHDPLWPYGLSAYLGTLVLGFIMVRRCGARVATTAELSPAVSQEMLVIGRGQRWRVWRSFPRRQQLQFLIGALIPLFIFAVAHVHSLIRSSPQFQVRLGIGDFVWSLLCWRLALGVINAIKEGPRAVSWRFAYCRILWATDGHVSFSDRAILIATFVMGALYASGLESRRFLGITGNGIDEDGVHLLRLVCTKGAEFYALWGLLGAGAVAVMLYTIFAPLAYVSEFVAEGNEDFSDHQASKRASPQAPQS